MCVRVREIAYCNNNHFARPCGVSCVVVPAVSLYLRVFFRSAVPYAACSTAFVVVGAFEFPPKTSTVSGLIQDLTIDEFLKNPHTYTIAIEVVMICETLRKSTIQHEYCFTVSKLIQAKIK